MAKDPTIGLNLQRLRRIAGLTQEQLAERAALHPDIVRKLEQGQRDSPRVSTLRRLADALDVDVSELVAPAAGRPDRSTAAYLAGLVQHVRVLDDTAPTGSLLTLSGQLLATSETLMEAAAANQQRDIGRAAAEAALVDWWLTTDANQDATAAYATALSLAIEWDVPALVGHLFGWRAGVALRDGHLHRAVQLARRARDARWGMSLGALGWAAGFEARAQAFLGDQDGASRALDIAQEAFEQVDVTTEPPWMYWLAPMVEKDRADLQLLREGPDAVPTLEAAIAGHPEDRARDVAWYRAHIASSRVFAGDIEGALVDAEEAARLSAAAGTNWAIGDLVQLAGLPHLGRLREVLADHGLSTPPPTPC